MSAEAQIMLWGLAIVLPIALNIVTRRGSDALGLSLMLGMIWLLGRLLWAFDAPPESLRFYPVIDLVAGLITIYAWGTQREWWKLALTGCFLFQITLATGFWLAWPFPGSLLRYLRANNVAFAIELLCVGAPGIAELARLLVSRLPHRSWHRHHAKA